MSRLKLEPGVVLKITAPAGSGYVQYIGEHPELGGTLWVLPGLVSHEPSNLSDLAWGSGYYAFYPVRTALRRGMVTTLGMVPLEGRSIPELMRRAGGISNDGRVLNWIISSGQSEQLVHQLGEADRFLPIAAIWNHEMLLIRISKGWRPETAV